MSIEPIEPDHIDDFAEPTEVTYQEQFFGVVAKKFDSFVEIIGELIGNSKVDQLNYANVNHNDVMRMHNDIMKTLIDINNQVKINMCISTFNMGLIMGMIIFGRK